MRPRESGVSKLVDAHGNETKLFRQDARFPGLVTRVEYPNGHFGTASYNDRGNVASVVNGPRVVNGATLATTLYAYENSNWPDFVTRMTQPEGGSDRDRL